MKNEPEVIQWFKKLCYLDQCKLRRAWEMFQKLNRYDVEIPKPDKDVQKIAQEIWDMI